MADTYRSGSKVHGKRTGKTRVKRSIKRVPSTGKTLPRKPRGELVGPGADKVQLPDRGEFRTLKPFKKYEGKKKLLKKKGPHDKMVPKS